MDEPRKRSGRELPNRHLQSAERARRVQRIVEGVPYDLVRVGVCNQGKVHPVTPIDGLDFHVRDVAHPDLVHAYGNDVADQVGPFPHPVTGVGRPCPEALPADQHAGLPEQVEQPVAPHVVATLVKHDLQLPDAQAGKFPPDLPHLVQQRRVVHRIDDRRRPGLPVSLSGIAKQPAE